MEKHFLADKMEGASEFRAEPWYNPYGDCIVYQMADEAVVADRVDELLTVYKSAVDDRPIGYQIKGVAAIIGKFGLDGLVVRAEAIRPSQGRQVLATGFFRSESPLQFHQRARIILAHRRPHYRLGG